MKKRNASQGNLQFGNTMPNFNFNSTITSERTDGKLVLNSAMNSAMNSQQLNTILPNDQHILTVTGDYDTMETGNGNMFRKVNRAVSQGRINIEKNFDVSTLFLPDIRRRSKLKIDKSQISQMIFDKPSL